MITYDQLRPAQPRAVERAAASDYVVELLGCGGAGETTILQILPERLGGS